ncbi:hypothetical protein SARC_18074, partial [Sphaeroforma arctica JP610]
MTPTPSATVTASPSATLTASPSPSMFIPAFINGTVIKHVTREGIENVTVTAVCVTDATISYTAVAGADGSYSIGNVVDCEYNVTVPVEHLGDPVFTDPNVTVVITPDIRYGEADF